MEPCTTGLKKRCHPSSSHDRHRISCDSVDSIDSCCKKPGKLQLSTKQCEDDHCCTGDDLDESIKGGLHGVKTTDLESGFGTLEHAVLSISGMTCTGCEKSADIALKAIPSIAKVEVSLMLSRAEFDLDISAMSIEEVIDHIKRKTGFSCEQITNNGQELDVSIRGNERSILGQPLPEGVTGLTSPDKKTIRILYNPSQVGARDLLEKGFGQPLQLAPIRPHPSIAAGNKHVRKEGFMTLLSALLTIPVLVFAWAPLPDHQLTYSTISLALATIVQICVAGRFYPKALKNLLFYRLIEMDLLIVLSTSAAYVTSVVAFGFMVIRSPLSIGEFFETSTLLVTLIMLGRFISALSRQKAVESISVRSLQSNTAIILSKESENGQEIDARLLQYGDIFKVAPESKVPTDGTVIQGTSEVDESMVTGEARLVTKTIRSAVIAGSINGSGTLKVRVTHLPGDNTISAIANMVDEAKLSKPKIQELSDKVAGYFVPVIVVITIITFAIWIAVGIAARKQPASEVVVQAVTYAIAVLIVSCPCAIGIAVPMVVVIAGGVAAERGVIFKTAETIENARKATHVVFDKTGTLTKGQLRVRREHHPDGGKPLNDSILLGLIGNITHPVSSAVAKYLKAQGVTPTAFSSVRAIPGKGVEGSLEDGTIIRAGNCHWLNLSTDPNITNISRQDLTIFCMTMDSNLRTIFGLADTLRPEAEKVIKTLYSRGISVSILSGDDHGPVQSIASELDIATSHIKSRCSPADKQQYIGDLLDQTTNGQKNTVLFIGDGTNDAPALATASIGIHINEGTDVASTAADAVLLSPNLGAVLTLIDISKAAHTRILFNFGWSFFYNTFAVLLAAGAFVNFRIPPEFAGLGELVSVLPVIAIAVALKWVRFEKF